MKRLGSAMVFAIMLFLAGCGGGEGCPEGTTEINYSSGPNLSHSGMCVPDNALRTAIQEGNFNFDNIATSTPERREP